MTVTRELNLAPPGTSDEHISVAQYLEQIPGLNAVLVTTPQEIAMMDVRKEIDFCQKSHIKMLGLIENMSGYQTTVSSLKFVDYFGSEITDDVIANIQTKYPELLNYRISSQIFPQFGDGPKGMADTYGISFLGKVPMDPKLLQSCEEGYCYIKREPDGCATPAMVQIKDKIMRLLEKN